MFSKPHLMIAVGAIAMIAGISSASGAMTTKPAKIQTGAGVEATPVVARNCYPIFGYSLKHYTNTSLAIKVRRIIGYRCLPLAVLRPRFRDPGPLRRNFRGRINPRINVKRLTR